MDKEHFGRCTQTLTMRVVVTERQSCNKKRRYFPRSMTPLTLVQKLDGRIEK
jgi:hypothetical protein